MANDKQAYKNILNSLFVRDPRLLFPPPRRYVPVWTEAGQEPLFVALVHQDYVPLAMDRPEQDKMETFGEIVDDFPIDNCVYVPADDDAIVSAQNVAQEMAIRQREEETVRQTLARKENRRARRLAHDAKKRRGVSASSPIKPMAFNPDDEVPTPGLFSKEERELWPHTTALFDEIHQFNLMMDIPTRPREMTYVHVPYHGITKLE
ncbi:hypothetical protein GNI_049770 [Gregarina niphandrodes]|uniref:Uncharacterized protein n=1 Tax=Gregarina niphandrodes TaxID=110365 RepID=A0A023B9Q7_GRENI|nr:hypothetical protein GNI_049770 [Gregarina niphandrodes]EZG73000.1 hypothetical protein GNI_049770 [Gregarina niphandrodes]|eukprot:XP_011129695.1 hypothetical protein GNI_049770 [Gregarina niphandrodes]